METDFFSLPLAIGTGVNGAQRFELHLGEIIPSQKVSGVGFISQPANSSMALQTELSGDFSFMTVAPHDTHILVVLDDKNGVKVRMVLNDDWSKGVANYSYTDNRGKLVELTNIPVEKM
jgi:hypothetical protein